MEDFAARREAFTALGFPWRRGFLLIGPPGMGKTMACRGAAAALHDRPFLYVRDCQSGHGAGALQIIFAPARRLPPASSPSRTLTGWRKSAAMARRCSAFALDCTSRQGLAAGRRAWVQHARPCAQPSRAGRERPYAPAEGVDTPISS
ncbi:MAG: AAA family ATPase [Thermomicrobiales bacterium]